MPCEALSYPAMPIHLSPLSQTVSPGGLIRSTRLHSSSHGRLRRSIISIICPMPAHWSNKFWRLSIPMLLLLLSFRASSSPVLSANATAARRQPYSFRLARPWGLYGSCLFPPRTAFTLYRQALVSLAATAAATAPTLAQFGLPSKEKSEKNTRKWVQRALAGDSDVKHVPSCDGPPLQRSGSSRSCPLLRGMRHVRHLLASGRRTITTARLPSTRSEMQPPAGFARRLRDGDGDCDCAPRGRVRCAAIVSRTKTTYEVISAGGESCAPEISTWGVNVGRRSGVLRRGVSGRWRRMIVMTGLEDGGRCLMGIALVALTALGTSIPHFFASFWR
ncbi:hypothetical protein BGZ61DRAFT_517032 [Ilyonectria robusta]|uniref:uncharacterized protein n=1 Tax=Ilyonectria robusta TaxID=1079257 RepID=UPI001E8D88D3|nr:uncharacterized protein BGZ61DRAFT_517032 [Ilyonectria robusta]KAH8706352.1 hypothetical protein BGZ61DRAFT_517032 [Ilyonectria robusta]